jgi:hypothetical protein
LLNFHDQELAIDTTFEILKQCAFEEEEKLEPEPNEKTMAVLKSTKWPGLIEAGIKVLEEIDWQQEQATNNNKRIMNIFAFYEEILQEK